MNFLYGLIQFYLLLGVMGKTLYNYCDLVTTVCYNRPHVGCLPSARLLVQQGDDVYISALQKLIDQNQSSPQFKWDNELETLSTMLAVNKFSERSQLCLSSYKFLDVRPIEINYTVSSSYDYLLYSFGTISFEYNRFQSIGCTHTHLSRKRNKNFSTILCLYNYSNRSTLLEYKTMTEKYRIVRKYFNLNGNDVGILYFLNVIVWIGNLIILFFLYAIQRYEVLRYIDRGSYY